MHEVNRTRRTRRGASRALAYLTLIPAFALLLATSASANVTALSGGAFGESVSVTPLIGPTVTSGPTPTVTLPPGGSVTPITATQASVTVAGLLNTGVLNVSTQGTLGAGGSVLSSANATGVSVGSVSAPVLTAGSVASQCRSDEQGSTGSTTVSAVTILGAPATLPTAPNSTVAITGIGTLTVNEQTVAGTPPAASSITVNALHLRLNGTLGTGDIIVAQSRCSITGNGVIVPTGAIGGVLLTGVVAVAFTLYQFSRSRARRHPAV